MCLVRNSQSPSAMTSLKRGSFAWTVRQSSSRSIVRTGTSEEIGPWIGMGIGSTRIARSRAPPSRAPTVAASAEGTRGDGERPVELLRVGGRLAGGACPHYFAEGGGLHPPRRRKSCGRPSGRRLAPLRSLDRQHAIFALPADCPSREKCTGRDLNPYASRRRNLNPLRLPIS